MRNITITTVLSVLILSGCVNRKVGQSYCQNLHRAERNSDGFYYRQEILESVGYKQMRVGISLLNGSEMISLDGGYFLSMRHRGMNIDMMALSPKTIDEILNNPDRTLSSQSVELESVVLVDKSNREVCRFSASKGYAAACFQN